MGGMFSRIRPNWLLTLAFTQCLAGLLTVAVRDLELKVEAVEYESKLLQGTARSYPLTHGGDLVSFRFGNHYSREMGDVTVSLPTISREPSVEILKVTYSYGRSSSGRGGHG